MLLANRPETMGKCPAAVCTRVFPRLRPDNSVSSGLMSSLCDGPQDLPQSLFWQPCQKQASKDCI